MKRVSILVIAAVFLLTPGGVFASEGTESPFSFGAGARELALGGAAVTTVSDATSVFWNPSRLASAQRISAIGMHSELLIDGAVYQYFGVIVPTLDLGGFGIGLFRQSIQDIEKRDENNLYLDHFDDSNLRVYLGYGRRMGRFELGASLLLDHQSIDTYRATSSPGLTLSGTYTYQPKQPWLSDLMVGAVVRNLLRPGIKLAEETYKYPTSLELASSVRVSARADAGHTFEPYVMLRKIESIPVRFNAGIEYGYKEVLRIRGGMRQGNLSFGAGLNLGMVSFDYALVDRDLDFIHLFALTASFGQTVEERRKSRAERMESDFREAMNEQMRSRNLALMDELLSAGRAQLESGSYDEAAGSFDRLVFLARSIEVDESDYQRLLDSAMALQSESDLALIVEVSVDSARTYLASGDLLSARHYALRALEADSSCVAARVIFDDVNEALRSQSQQSEFLSEQLTRVDKLIDRQRFDQAESIIQSLTDIAPDDDAVMRRINRLELERLRRKIADMEARRYESAQRDRTDTAGADGLNEADELAAAVPLTEERRVQLDGIYQEAKNLFNGGDIRGAVRRWEAVAAEAPDFLSVREFLVKAYKFLGLELYGEKQRARAIEVWRKALALDPDNVDIAEYIKRAETQMKKLEELAHEQR